VLKSQVYRRDRIGENWLKQEEGSLPSFLPSFLPSLRSLLFLPFVRLPKRSTQLPASDKVSTCMISSSWSERQKDKLETKKNKNPDRSFCIVSFAGLFCPLARYVSKLGCHHFVPFSLSYGLLQRSTSM